MDRRSTLAAIFSGNKHQTDDRLAKAPVFTVNTGLEPFSGQWILKKQLIYCVVPLSVRLTPK